MVYKNAAQFSAGIIQFDKYVRAADLTAAFGELAIILPAIESGNRPFGAQSGLVHAFPEQEATILASAIVGLLTHPDLSLIRSQLSLMCSYKRAVSQVFEISGYRGTGHFVGLFSERNENGDRVFKNRNIPKLFCGLSINAMTEPLLQLLLRQQGDVSWPIVNGFLSEQILWNADAEDVRGKLLALSDHWKDLQPTDKFIRNLGQPYMGCSYADAPHKHTIKTLMNRMARTWLASKGAVGIPAGDKRAVASGKPTLLILAELYNSTHAMHRCYGPAIRGLRDHFKLVYMSPLAECDPKLTYMFDVIDNTRFSASDPAAYFNKVKSYKPDMVYFPSVGMRLVSILGSNLRLAPIQLMTYGHPGTTMSENIDYAVIVDGQLGSEDTLNEKILYWPAVARYEHRADAQQTVTNIRENPKKIRIAVPAFTRKITPKFLKTCAKIEAQANKKVEFIFFPNSGGALFQAAKRRFESMVTATVLPRKNYNAYVTDLNDCDIFLSTFPFGATNGILDASRQGLPIVNMKGGELHAFNDSEMVAQVGQPDWLSVDTEEEYIAAVLRLIDNDDERIAISKANAAYDFDADMMVSVDGACSEFGTAFKAAYLHHEKMQASSQKSWRHRELQHIISGSQADPQVDNIPDVAEGEAHANAV